MRSSSLSGPDTIPAEELRDVARRITFSSAITPAPPHVDIDPGKSTRFESDRPTTNDDGAHDCSNIVSAPADNHASSSPAESISVVLRIRPLTDAEIKDGPSAIKVDNDQPGVIHVIPRNPALHSAKVRAQCQADFRFSKVYGTNSTQDDLFCGTTLPLIQSLFDGKSGLVFAYGTSNAGKTHTIQGTPEQPGILPRSLDVIFNSIARASRQTTRAHGRNKKESMILADDEESAISFSSLLSDGSAAEWRNVLEEHGVPARAQEDKVVKARANSKYVVSVSYLEIYNEQCYDLLARPDYLSNVKPESTTKNEPCLVNPEDKSGELTKNRPSSPPGLKARARRRPLKLKEDRKLGEVYAVGLTEVSVSNATEVEKLILLGQQNRSVAQTCVNTRSSRSHTIFCIKLSQKVRETKSHRRRSLMRDTVSKLSIVDLAGNERASRTNNTGERLKEASLINTSLMSLGHCLEKLRQNQRINTKQPLRAINGNVAEERSRSGKWPQGNPGRKGLQTVPFRESKLTRLFQRNLQNGLTVMIANVSPAIRDADETIHSLRRAAVAREVTTSNKSNNNQCIKSSDARSERLISPSRLVKVQQQYESRAEADAQRIVMLTDEISSLKNALEERTMEFDLERQELEREQDELWRENELLRDRLSHAESRFAVREQELREEIMQATEEILAEKDERYRKELARLWESGQEASHARCDVATSTARKKIERMEERHRREIGSTIARRVSMAVMPQIFEEDEEDAWHSSDDTVSADEVDADYGPLANESVRKIHWGDLASETCDEEFDEEDYEMEDDENCCPVQESQQERSRALKDADPHLRQSLVPDTRKCWKDTDEASSLVPSNGTHSVVDQKLSQHIPPKDGMLSTGFRKGRGCKIEPKNIASTRAASHEHSNCPEEARLVKDWQTRSRQEEQEEALEYSSQKQDCFRQKRRPEDGMETTVDSSVVNGQNSAYLPANTMETTSMSEKAHENRRSQSQEAHFCVQNSDAGQYEVVRDTGEVDITGTLWKRNHAQADRLQLYGDGVATFHARVIDMVLKGELDFVPVGPVGEFIRIVDVRWAETTEKAIGFTHLSSYLASNAREARVLRNILREIQAEGVHAVPKIAVMNWDDKKTIDDAGKFADAAMFKPMRDVIEVLDGRVFRYLVSRCELNQNGLVESLDLLPSLGHTKDGTNVKVLWDDEGHRAVLCNGSFVLRPLRKSACVVRNLLQVSQKITHLL